MPFPRSWSLYSLGAFLFFGLILWISRPRETFKELKIKCNLVLPLFLYFLIHLAGLFFTKPEWSYIEGVLMFILVPLLGFPLFISREFTGRIRFILKAFIFGLFTISLFYYGRALWMSFSYTGGALVFDPHPEPLISYFRSDLLSIFEHPSYLSLKILMSLSILILLRSKTGLPGYLTISLVILQLIFIYSLSSRTGLLISFILITYLVYRLLKNKKARLLILLIIPVLAYVFFKVSSLNERVVDRTGPVWERYRAGEIKIKDIDPRFTSWFTAWDLIKQDPFSGVGLDARDILAAQYEQTGYHNEAKLRLNAHNQYLENQLTFGITGSAILIWMLLLPLFRRKHSFLPDLVLPFIIIVSSSMMFESILVRQWGVMFFVLFYCILLLPAKNGIR